MALAATADIPATGQQQQQPAPRTAQTRKRQRARRSDIGKARKPAAATPAPVSTIQPTAARSAAMAARAATKIAGAEHPLALGLFQALPAAGEKLTMEDAKVWLDTCASMLKLIYKFPGSLTVTASPVAA
jgi:hypothetical protein